MREVPDVVGSLTGQQGQGAHAGEGGHVQVHPAQAGRELKDAVDPLAEAPQALEAGPHGAVAEDQPGFLRVRPETGRQREVPAQKSEVLHSKSTGACVCVCGYR